MRVAFIDGQVIMWPKGKTIDDVVVIEDQEGGLYKSEYPEFRDHAIIRVFQIKNNLKR